jgi:hypothetical protein
MSRIVDNLIAFKILKKLVTPFIDTEAYKLGIIDKNGKVLKKTSSMTSSEEREAFTYLDRLVFNMKKIINKLPGGESKLKSLVAGLWLVKEQYESGNRSTVIMQEKFDNIMKMLENRVSLVEEEIIVKRFLEEDGAVGGAPTNSTAGASVSEPKIYPKDVKKYKAGQGMTIAGMVRRPKPVVTQ